MEVFRDRDVCLWQRPIRTNGLTVQCRAASTSSRHPSTPTRFSSIFNFQSNSTLIICKKANNGRLHRSTMHDIAMKYHIALVDINSREDVGLII